MYIDHYEDVTLVDNVIDLETTKQLAQSKEQMIRCGCQLPNTQELPDFILSIRDRVQHILEQSN